MNVRFEHTDGVEVGRGDSRAIVLHLDGVEAIILEADLYTINQYIFTVARGVQGNAPIEVAPASRLFSTSSCGQYQYPSLEQVGRAPYFRDRAKVNNDLSGLDLVD